MIMDFDFNQAISFRGQLPSQDEIDYFGQHSGWRILLSNAAG